MRRRAAFEIADVGALVGDDQRALELAGILLVDAEIGRQLHRAAHARRHVDERAVGKHRRIERGEEIVGDRHHRAEIFPHQLRMLVHRFRDRAEDHAGLGELRLEGGRDRNRIEHRVDRDLAHARRRRESPARAAECRAFRRFAEARDRPRRATSAPASLSARNNNRGPGSRSSGIFDSRPFGLAHGQPAAIGRRAASRCSHSGSFFLAEMKRTMSSERPFGALSDSISVEETVFVGVDVDGLDSVDGLFDSRHSFSPRHGGFKARRPNLGRKAPRSGGG